MQEKELYKMMSDGLRDRMLEICLAEPEMTVAITLVALSDLMAAMMMTAPTEEMCLEAFEECVGNMKTKISSYNDVKREKQD